MALTILSSPFTALTPPVPICPAPTHGNFSTALLNQTEQIAQACALVRTMRQDFSLKPLARLCSLLNAGRGSEAFLKRVKEATLKSHGYFFRFFSAENWFDWTEHRTALGRFFSCPDLNRCDRKTVCEANQIAQEVLKKKTIKKKDASSSQKIVSYIPSKPLTPLPFLSPLTQIETIPAPRIIIPLPYSPICSTEDDVNRIVEAATQGKDPDFPTIFSQSMTHLLQLTQEQPSTVCAGDYMYLIDTCTKQFFSLSHDQITDLFQLFIQLLPIKSFSVDERKELGIKMAHFLNTILPSIEGWDSNPNDPKCVDLLLDLASAFPNENEIIQPLLVMAKDWIIGKRFQADHPRLKEFASRYDHFPNDYLSELAKRITEDSDLPRWRLFKFVVQYVREVWTYIELGLRTVCTDPKVLSIVAIVLFWWAQPYLSLLRDWAHSQTLDRTDRTFSTEMRRSKGPHFRHWGPLGRLRLAGPLRSHTIRRIHR